MTKNDIKNSDVIKKVLFSLIYVSTGKTSRDYAWSVMKNITNELIQKHDFLKYVKIKIEKDDKQANFNIQIDKKIDDIDSTLLGKSIQNYIDFLKIKLGKKAGYFFLQEFKVILGDKYHNIIKQMGVDLRLIDLKEEFGGIDYDNYQIKESPDSNIGFIKKTM